MSAIDVIPRTLGLLAVLALTAASTRGDDPPARPSFDLERVFDQAGTDSDGTMSKQEFQFVAANGPRLRDDPQRADRVFGMLDADRDGSLSVEAPEKIADRPQAFAQMHTGVFQLRRPSVGAWTLHLLGLDHQKLTCRYAGRDMRLTDVKGNVVKEILA